MTKRAAALLGGILLCWNLTAAKGEAEVVISLARIIHG